MPDPRPHAPHLWHQVAGIGHQPRPGQFGAQVRQFRIDRHHLVAQLPCDAGDIGGAGGDAAGAVLGGLVNGDGKDAVARDQAGQIAALEVCRPVLERSRGQHGRCQERRRRQVAADLFEDHAGFDMAEAKQWLYQASQKGNKLALTVLQELALAEEGRSAFDFNGQSLLGEG